LEPEWWTIVLSRGAGGTGLPPVLLSGYVDAFSALFRGGSLSEVQRHQVDVVVPPPDFRAGLLLSIVAGLVVFPLVVAALPEGAAIAALTAAFGGTVLAGLAAGVIVAACAGVLAGVSAAVAQRFVLALAGDFAWDEVLDEKVLARDAVIGGMLNAASFGVGQAISKARLAIQASKDAKKLAVLNVELSALEKAQARLAEWLDERRTFARQERGSIGLPPPKPSVVPQTPIPKASSPIPQAEIDLIDDVVSRQAQARHIEGTPAWTARGQGGYLKSDADAQAVLDAVKNGDAQILGRTANGQLLVKVPSVTGYNNNAAAGFLDQPTNVFIVKGTSKVSVVPTNPGAIPK
jgi:hypothetical protein